MKFTKLFVVAVAATFALASCGGESTTETTDTAAVVEEVTVEEVPVADTVVSMEIEPDSIIVDTAAVVAE